MVDAPQWIDPQAWAAFLEMRRAKGRRAPFTELAAQRVIYELARLKEQGHPPAEVLWQSTVNGWSGVFPLKHLANISAKPLNSNVEQTARYLQERASIVPTGPSPEVRAKLAALSRRGNQS